MWLFYVLSIENQGKGEKGRQEESLQNQEWEYSTSDIAGDDSM